MKQPPPPSQIRSVAIGVVVLALYPLWETWVVLSSGSMATIHCNGQFSGTLCSLGSFLGRLIFGANKAHLGYAIVSGSFGLLLVSFAWRSYAKTRHLVMPSYAQHMPNQWAG
jgi:hypothetical protein